jgi:hypothetical protein
MGDLKWKCLISANISHYLMSDGLLFDTIVDGAEIDKKLDLWAILDIMLVLLLIYLTESWFQDKVIGEDATLGAIFQEVMPSLGEEHDLRPIEISYTSMSTKAFRRIEH